MIGRVHTVGKLGDVELDEEGIRRIVELYSYPGTHIIFVSNHRVLEMIAEIYGVQIERRGSVETVTITSGDAKITFAFRS